MANKNMMMSVTTAKRKEQEGITENLHSKTFLAWMNGIFKSKQMGDRLLDPSKDLFSQLNDGVHLCRLMEALYGKKIQGKLKENATTEIQKLENVSLAIDFLKNQKVNVTVSSKDIVDGNRKLTLGLIWRLVLDHNLLDPSQTTEDLSIVQRNKQAKANLLAFCQKQVSPYGVKVEDLTNSWYDGRAFCALVHSIDSSLLDWNKVQQGNDAQNLRTAFEAAEKLGITKMLDVEDMTNPDPEAKPDEKCIMTYLSEFPPVFFERLQRKNQQSDQEELKRRELLLAQKHKEEEDKQRMEIERHRQEQRRRIEQEMAKQREEAIRREQERLDREAQERYNAERLAAEEAERRDAEEARRTAAALQESADAFQRQMRESALHQQLDELRRNAHKLQEEEAELARNRQKLIEEQTTVNNQAIIAPSDLPSNDALLAQLLALQEELARLQRENAQLKAELGHDTAKFLKLFVKVTEARGLRPTSALGRCDPYAKLKLEQQEYKTHKQKNTLNPVWGQEFELFVSASRSELEISVWDDKFTGDAHMGRALLRLSDLVIGSSETRWLTLQPFRIGEKVSGEVLITFVLQPSN